MNTLKILISLIVVLCLTLLYNVVLAGANFMQTQINYNYAIKLKETTLLVAIDDEKSAIDQALMNAVNTYWKYTPYKFIKSSEIEKNCSDPSYSFLVKATYGTTSTNYQPTYLFLLLGKKGAQDLSELSRKTSERILRSIEIVLPYEGDMLYKTINKSLRDYSIYLPFYLNYFQDIMNAFSSKESISWGEPRIEMGNHRVCINSKFYNNGKKELQNKTLLINKNELSNEFNKENFDKNFYKNTKGLNLSYKIVEPTDIQRAIEQKETNYVFWYNVQYFNETGKGKGYVGYIYSCNNDKQLSYFNTLDTHKVVFTQAAKMISSLIVSIALLTVLWIK